MTRSGLHVALCGGIDTFNQLLLYTNKKEYDNLIMRKKQVNSVHIFRPVCKVDTVLCCNQYRIHHELLNSNHEPRKLGGWDDYGSVGSNQSQKSTSLVQRQYLQHNILLTRREESTLTVLTGCHVVVQQALQ